MNYKLLFLSIILLCSCKYDIEYINYNKVKDKWHMDSIQKFEFRLNNVDSTIYNSFINLRISNDYEFNNIFLITKLSDSLQLIYKDTLEYKLADKFGKFMGSRNINITEISLLHKENIHFENNKYYNLTIEHAMRGINKVKGIENLKGIIDIGYKIKKID